METQKIINFLNDSSNEEPKFATKKKWYAIDSPTAKDTYDQNNSIKFEAEIIKPSLCDYSYAFILVTGEIIVNTGNNIYVVFKNCAPFSTYKTEINDVFIDEVNHIYIAMPTYNLIEYSDNYSNISGSLWQFKRDEPPANNADLNVNNSVFNSQSFKHKTALAEKQQMLLMETVL